MYLGRKDNNKKDFIDMLARALIKTLESQEGKVLTKVKTKQRGGKSKASRKIA